MRRSALSIVGAVFLTTLTGCRIELADYCDGTDQVDDTACIGEWVEAGRAKPHRLLYGSPGTYLYVAPVVPYSNMRIDCAGPEQTTFRNTGGSGSFIEAAQPIDRLRISECSFDVNGNPSDFLAVIDISPDHPTPSTRLRVLRNRIFDSVIPGQRSSAQRQYVALLNCRDCVVSGNHLTEGGRIKVGRPGRDIRIKSNVVENANDNAITVADINDGQSEDIVIDDNQVINPLAIGIYFGADGDSQTSSLMRLRNVRVRNNTISGNWVSACIFGRLPAQAEEFRVLGNTCTKTGPTVNAATGIRIRRPDGTHPPARDVKVENNRILTTLSPGASPRPLDFGGLFHTGNHDRVRVRNNEVVNVGERAMVFRDQITNAQILDNEIVGGVIQVEGTIQGAVQDHVIVGAGSVIAALAGAASAARIANALIGRRAHRVP